MGQGQTAHPAYGALHVLVRYGDWVAATSYIFPTRVQACR